MKILVSGFEPFLNEKINPTARLVDFVNSCDSHLPAWKNLDLRGVLLPVLFDRAFEKLENERVLFRPDVILSFGLAGGRESIDVEHVAINYRGGDQTSRGDNAGATPEGEILEGAPLALRSTLPVETILRELQRAKIPARRSFSAGTYVCNDLFFQLQHRLQFTTIASGFIHVPRLVESGGEETLGAWSWAKFESALAAILAAIELSRPG